MVTKKAPFPLPSEGWGRILHQPNVPSGDRNANLGTWKALDIMGANVSQQSIPTRTDDTRKATGFRSIVWRAMEHSGQRISARHNGVGTFLFLLVMVITTATFSYIAVMSLCLTDIFYPDPHAEVITPVFWLSNPQSMLAGLLWLLLVSALLYLLCRMSEHLNERVVLGIVILATGTLSCFLVLAVRSAGHHFPDAFSLIEYASRAARGDWGSFLPASE
jgi:hypothetical protein